jgi:[protein-PII] uridylyltransferase
VRVQNAKIGTFGNRAEDVFYITDQANAPLTDPARLEALRDELLRALEPEAAERTG